MTSDYSDADLRALFPSLVGKWIHIVEGEYCRMGEITRAIGENHYLVKMRPPAPLQPASSCMMTIDQMCSDLTRKYFVDILDTEAELDAWIAFMDEDQSPRVVQMRATKEE